MSKPVEATHPYVVFNSMVLLLLRLGLNVQRPEAEVYRVYDLHKRCTQKIEVNWKAWK